MKRKHPLEEARNVSRGSTWRLWWFPLAGGCWEGWMVSRDAKTMYATLRSQNWNLWVVEWRGTVMKQWCEDRVSVFLLSFCIEEEVQLQEEKVTYPVSHIHATGRNTYGTVQYFKMLIVVWSLVNDTMITSPANVILSNCRLMLNFGCQNSFSLLTDIWAWKNRVPVCPPPLMFSVMKPATSKSSINKYF